MSVKKSVSYWGSHGTVHGPIPLNIYVNDLASSLPNCDVTQYADDTHIVLSRSIDNLKDLISNAEDTLKLAKKDFNANGLMLNEKKKKKYLNWNHQAFITDPSQHPPDGRRQCHHPQFFRKELGHLF